MNFSLWLSWIIKPAVFLLCLLPLALLGYGFWQDALGANPIETIIRRNGDWALRFLLITLAISPLRQITGQRWLLRLRRMLGLYAFFYALMHLLSYIVLDQFFDWPEIWKDIVKRPYITIGMTSFALLIPLAITSIDRIVEWMTKERWNRLHRLVYLCALLGVVHYYMLVKADVREPLIYGAVLALLFGYRFWQRRRETQMTETKR